MSLSTVPCKGCGTSCLGDEAPDACNVCDPVVSAMIAWCAENPVSEIEEILL